MARGFKRQHPEKLRPVVASAVLDRGLSAPAAMRALERGELEGWQGAYKLPLSTLQGYVAAEENRRRELTLKAADPAAVQTAVAAQVALLTRELDRRARAVNARSTLEEIRELARAQRELVLTSRALQGRDRSNSGRGAGPGQEDNSAHERTGDSADLLQQLANSSSSTAPTAAQPG